MKCCAQKEYGNMLKRIQVLEERRIPAKGARCWKIEGQKRRITRKDYRILWNEFETEGFMAQKGLWNVAREKLLEDRGALLREGRDQLVEYKATHKEHFFSSRLREDVVGTEEERKKMNKEAEEEENRSVKRQVEREKGENGVENKVCESAF